MPPKDYVARGRAPAKKASAAKPTKKKAPAKKAKAPQGRSAAASAPVESNGIPFVRIGFTLAVLVGFGVFLWNLKDSADSRRAEKQASQQVSTAPNGTAAKDDLPEMPEEKWEFIETLTDPDYEVKVELPKQADTSDKEYILQCGSFRKEEQAESMRAKIAFQGLESQIKPSNGKNGLWYRVILGPYKRKRAAEKDRHTLQRAGFNYCRVW